MTGVSLDLEIIVVDKISIKVSSITLWSKLSKGELTYGRGSASGVKMQGNKVRLKFNAIGILVGQHFINNTCLTNKCESQVFPLNKGTRVYQKHLSETT